MNRDEITRKLIELAAEQAGVKPEQVTAATHFRSDLNFDSLDEVEYAMNVEEQFDIDVPDESIEKLKTVGDVVELLAELLSETAPSAP